MVAVAPLPADGKLYDEADLAALNDDTKVRRRNARAVCHAVQRQP